MVLNVLQAHILVKIKPYPSALEPGGEIFRFGTQQYRCLFIFRPPGRRSTLRALPECGYRKEEENTTENSL